MIKTNTLPTLSFMSIFLFVLFCFPLVAQAQTGASDDFDGDGIINSADYDDDNDGILDIYECPPIEILELLSTDLNYNTANSTFTETKDISSNWDLANGSIIVTVTNGQWNGSDKWYVSNGLNTQFQFSGTVPVAITVSHDKSFTTTLDEKQITANDAVSYTLLTTPDAGFTHTVNLGDYTIQNTTGGALTNASDFVWQSDAAATDVTFSTTSSQPEEIIRIWVDPLVGSSICDRDNDGFDNQFDVDSDDDGCSDANEAGASTVELAYYQFPTSPVGTDGVPDAVQDPGQENSGTVNYTLSLDFQNAEIGSCSCPFADGLDTDNDLIGNSCDLDSDNDGITDALELVGGDADCTNGFFQVSSGQLKSRKSNGLYADIGIDNLAYNAMGYNTDDGFLYAIARVAGTGDDGVPIAEDDVIQINPRSGKKIKHGSPGLSGSFIAGDVANGSLYFSNLSGAPQSIFKYEIATKNVTTLSRSDDWRVTDFVIIDNVGYGLRVTNSGVVQLRSYDLSTNPPTFSNKNISSNFYFESKAFGAAFVANSNELYFANNSSGLYRIDDYTTASPTIVKAGSALATSSNDGASCPQTTLVSVDSDGDGVFDYLDLDSDNDGIPDVVEAEGKDPDDDGIVGVGAPVVNSNGIPVVANGGLGYDLLDTDGDATQDNLDRDSDNDGIVDVIEGQSTQDFVAPGTGDHDGDGILNAFDPDYTGPNPSKGGVIGVPSDVDGDGIPDFRDLDADGDGITDQVESGLTVAATTDDSDGDGILDDYDADGNSTSDVSGAGNGGQTPTIFTQSGGSLYDRDWRDNPVEIIWDGTNWYNGSDAGAPSGDESVNDKKSIRIMAGTPALLDNPTTILNFSIDEDAVLNVTSCLKVTGNAVNAGVMRLVATGDDNSEYGQYYGEALKYVECQMYFDNGWHNIGFPVDIRASDWASENNSLVEPVRVLMNNHPDRQNFRWYDSYTSGGKEIGFFVAPDLISSTTYSSHAYGTWNMVSDGSPVYNGEPDQNLIDKAFSYYIDDGYFTSSRILTATGTTNDQEKTYTTSNNFGGFNMIPNIYPVSIDANLVWNDPTNGFKNVSNIDQVIYIWDPTNSYQQPLPGDYGNGSYVAFDPETGVSVSAAPEVDGKTGHLIAPFQAFYIRRTDASTVRRIDEDGTDVYATNAAVNAGETVDPAVTNLFVDVTMSPDFRSDCNSTKHFKTNSVADLMFIQVREADNLWAGDAIEIVFDNKYTTAYDAGFDIFKISGGGAHAPTLFTIVDGQAMVINKQSYPEANRTIPVGFVVPQEKDGRTYVFNAIELPLGWSVYLEDKMTGAWHDLTQGDYSFTSNKSFDIERFVIHFNKTGSAIEKVMPAAIAWSNNQGIEVAMTNMKSKTAEIVVSNSIGQALHVANNVSTSESYVIPLHNKVATLYLVTIKTPELTKTIKVVR